MNEFQVIITFKPMKDLGGGFRTEWISGEIENKLRAGIDSGGGLGNPLMTFWYEKTGSRREYFTCHMGEVLSDSIDQLEKRQKAKSEVKS